MRIHATSAGRSTAGRAAAATLAALGLLLGGCISVRVGRVATGPARPPLSPQAVKVYRTFDEIGAPWRLEGMVMGYVAPELSNDAARREETLKAVAAEHGLPAVVGLLPTLGDGIGRRGRSMGLLASVGQPAEGAGAAEPRLIACMPPVRFQDALAEKLSGLAGYYREVAQFFLGYARGYYVTPCERPGVSAEGLRQGAIDVAALSKPLGIAPHYLLLIDVAAWRPDSSAYCLAQGGKWDGSTCDLTTYQIEFGTGGPVQLRTTLTLVEVAGGRVAWSKVHEGEAHVFNDALNRAESQGGAAASQDAYFRLGTLRPLDEAFVAALRQIPPIPGFRPGPGHPFDDVSGR